MPGGIITLSIENSIYLKWIIIGVIRNELPVLRAKARVSQNEITRKIGIYRQMYSSIEMGKREILLMTFLALISYFHNKENTKKIIFEINELSEGIALIRKSSNAVDEIVNEGCNYGRIMV